MGPGLAGIFQKEKLPNGKPVNDENMAEWIKSGSNYEPKPALPMPALGGQLSEQQIKDVIAYLKTLKK